MAWILLRPQSMAAAAVVLIVFADIVFFTGGAALSNLGHGEGVVPIAVPGTVAVASLAGFVAAAVVLAFPGPPRTTPLVLKPSHAAFAGLLIGAVIGALMLLARQLRNDKPLPGDVSVSMHTLSFSPGRLTSRGGPTTFFVGNRDLFWHTFTIDRPHGVCVPVGGARRVRVDLPPGRYEYHCRVPGHRTAGMKGVPVVS
ncbi:MAG: hypothetical protein JOZ68_00315 [Acidimicrobiia bacterium]|nr:hypothetical protein [Acidimicrobiia bacterium]